MPVSEPMKTPVLDLLSDETRWCRGTFARNKDGYPVASDHADAVSWCLVGAVNKCYGVSSISSGAAIGKLMDLSYRRSASGISSFNDAAGRTHAQILEVVKEAGV